MKAHHPWTLAAAWAFTGLAGPLYAQEGNASPGSAKEKLVGAWHMVSMEEQGADGKVTHHADRSGMLVLSADGHFSVQVMYPEAASAESASPVYAKGGYEATFGSYEIDEQAHTVTEHVQGSLVRTLVGKDLPRLYKLSDGRLRLRSARSDEHWSVTWEHY
jgi:hypothetical protein